VSAERLRRLVEARGGATAVEFALVLPVFTLLVMGVIQFGWAQHSAGSVRFALEQASRALLLNPSMSDTALQALVSSKLSPGIAAETTVSVQRVAAAGGGTNAYLTGLYVHQIGLPTMAALPVSFTKTVVTPLPAS
jgi:Flp pilus assembly protein TadG